MVRRPPLNDLFIRKIIAAIITYPQLAEQYEERLSSFDLSADVMSKILCEIIEIIHDDNYTDSENILNKLQLNYSAQINSLWELGMYKMQKSTLLDLKKEIDSGLDVDSLKIVGEQVIQD